MAAEPTFRPIQLDRPLGRKPIEDFPVYIEIEQPQQEEEPEVIYIYEDEDDNWWKEYSGFSAVCPLENIIEETRSLWLPFDGVLNQKESSNQFDIYTFLYTTRKSYQAFVECLHQ